MASKGKARTPLHPITKLLSQFASRIRFLPYGKGKWRSGTRLESLKVSVVGSLGNLQDGLINLVAT